MISSDKINVQVLVSLCKSNRIKNVVFSPGSRNAPLVIGFSNQTDFITHVIHDERSAGFFALGLIQMLNEPVIICCTSGSAVTNYYPAITEAYYRNLPLFVISADRPMEWVDQGDGQTIKQNNIFGHHVHHFYHVNDFQNDNDKWMFTREINKLFHALRKGPCHLNMSFQEPLYETKIVENLEKFDSRVLTDINISNDLFLNINSEYWSKKIMIIVGQCSKNVKLQNVLKSIAKYKNVVILAENISNLHDDNFIYCIDRVLQGIKDIKNNIYSPDVLIHLGGPIVSKKIKFYLRNIENLIKIRVSTTNYLEDTFQGLNYSIKCPEVLFLNFLNHQIQDSTSTNFSDTWKEIDFKSRDLIENFSQSLDTLNDWNVHYFIQQYIPENTVIHLGNSSIIRYMQLFDTIKDCLYFGNRGTSGIEGSLSTALGSAIASPEKEHLLIIGDISFIYDSNALWVRPFPENLKIIIINNAGGGIFRIIDGSKDSPNLEKYFEASHHQKCSAIINAFGFKCTTISTKENLEKEVKDLFDNEPKSPFLEIFTDKDDNPKVLNNFFKLNSNA